MGISLYFHELPFEKTPLSLWQNAYNNNDTFTLYSDVLDTLYVTLI